MRDDTWAPTLEDPIIIEYLEAAGGDRAIEIFRFIQENEPITGEDLLGHFPDDPPKEIRKVLYHLMDVHALEYARETDAKGWETFHWQTDIPEIRLVLLREWDAERKWIKKEIKHEESHEWYACPEGEERWIFEDAMDLDFRCPEHDVALVEDHPRTEDLEERLRALAPVS